MEAQAGFPAPFDRHAEPVRPEWIDYNGHMNVAFYVLAFDNATDTFFEAMDFGAAWRRRTDRSFFAVEGHVRYLGELKPGETLAITTQLVAADAKRIHYFHTMRNAASGAVAATIEFLSLHVDMRSRRAVPFAPDDRARIDAVARAHAHLPAPEAAGRRVSMPPLRIPGSSD
ncbi:MAG: thioesterase family protein [Proteobacteria bacterium]|nr:thioesterase family protein [Pseudomonadota bacterium]